jgi:(p)ppGpp synthase/HD superfamily hydrolase
MMSETDKVLPVPIQTALDLVYKLHGMDARKKTSIPYLTHLLSVCAIVQQDGGGEDEAIAALLHDALEDKSEQINAEEIEQLFNNRVAEIVLVSSDVPRDFRGGSKPLWKERKLAYLRHASILEDPSLLRVTLADKVDNLRAILTDHEYIGGDVWKRFNASKGQILWYYTQCYAAYRDAGYDQGKLMKKLKKLIKKFEKISSLKDRTEAKISYKV